MPDWQCRYIFTAAVKEIFRNGRLMQTVCWSVSGLIQFYCSAAFVKQLKRVPSGLYFSMFF